VSVITGGIDCGSLGFAHKIALVCVSAQSIRSGGAVMHAFFVQLASAYRSMARPVTNEPPRPNK